jgi:hypothetical protein
MPLTKYDEYFIHQTGDTIDTVAVKDLHFMDRCWFGCHSDDGRTYVAAGLGTYPNVSGHGVMDGSFCIIHNGVQRNFRASRHITHTDTRTDRTHSTVGPLSVQIVEPFKRLRFELGNNEFGIGGAIDFEARAMPFLYNKLDVPQHPMTHFTQLGYFNGNIMFEDSKIRLDRYHGVRDRTWGVRGKGLMRYVEAYFWIMAHFEGFCVNFSFFHVPVPGNNYRLQDGAIMHDDGSVTRLTEARHRFHFIEDTTRDGSTRLWNRLEVEFTDASGKAWQMDMKAVAYPFYNAGQGYDDRHGLDRGALNLEGERWDFTRAETIQGLRRTGDDRWHFDIHDQLVEATIDGIKGVGLVNNVCGPTEGWAYKPTLR